MYEIVIFFKNSVVKTSLSKYIVLEILMVQPYNQIQDAGQFSRNRTPSSGKADAIDQKK
jgi:hypothetical protein